ncbi:MAG: hypothetical protein QOH91_2902 [Mycobacterium sp.]|nr:hypothetical protein [Mycobacterium sp.]
MRQRDLDRVDGTDQVDIDHVAPRLQCRPAFHAGNAGPCDHDVELAELGESGVESGAQLRGLAHVGPGDHGGLAGVFDEPGGYVEILGCRHRATDRVDVMAHVDGNDVDAFLR